ncbi:FAD-dependent oxidoreductase [Saccharopolyspora sp. NPDC049357]|uniref:FAD-dependent oxidoreductase n=1 Tax=Saccharopolyspora sp. NPDC049357 TaxID=3154507 RepID=UPI0034235FA2
MARALMAAMERIVIVGGDAAGMSAASRLARWAPGARVIVYEREDVVSYAACGMPYHLDGRIPDASTLLVRAPEKFADAGIDVRLGHEVVAIDPSAGKVLVRGDGAERAEDYDKLLLATGARAVLPALPGRDADNVFLFRRYADLTTLTAYLERDRPRRMTVVGGGYIGIELADVLTQRGLAVTLVEAAPQLMPTTLDAAAAKLAEEELRSRGVEVRLGEQVTEIVTAAGRGRAVRTTHGQWECDAVIVGVGVRPETALATEAGIAVDGRSGAIATDISLRTDAEGVWAAGDCATTTHAVTGQRAWIPLGPAANKQGRSAADAMLGLPARVPGVVGTSLVKVFDLEVGSTGLTAEQALSEGFDAATTTITSTDRAHYYPNAAPTTVTLVADRKSNRLLGGQITGRTGVAGRTNVIATALHSGMDVEQFTGLDLGYAPPFAPVWDPLLVAGNQLLHTLNASTEEPR